MQRLVAGIHQFRSQYFASNKALFERLAKHGQNPHTLFITCADSRVVPNLITSTDPGDLFTVRNVGNIVPAVEGGLMGGVAAAIEFAVEVLGVESIIVCGHTECGAVKAMLDPSSARHLKYVSRWIRESESLMQILAERYPDRTGAAFETTAIEENVLLQLEHLRSFDFVRERLDAGTLTMSGWVFHIGKGEVFHYDPEVEQFVSLTAG